jgi:hypothetical protein
MWDGVLSLERHQMTAWVVDESALGEAVGT